MKGSMYIFSCLLVSLNINLSYCRDVCVKYEATEVCGPSSTWAVTLPNLTITHNFDIIAHVAVTLSYSLHLTNGSKITLCSYSFSHTNTICNQYGSNCIQCINALKSNNTLKSIFEIPDIYEAKDNSNLTYDFFANNEKDTLIHKLAVKECPRTMNNASLVDQSADTCGYNCIGRFHCLEGYTNQSYVDFTEPYLCNEDAQWDHAPPTCVEVKEVTTTATMLVTTADKEKSDPEKLVDCSKAAFTITSVGCILTVLFAVTVACVMKKVWHFKKEPAAKMFYLGFVAAAAACVLAIGLLFGSTACVAAIIIGAIGICGMLLVTGLYAREAITETKGIQGKKIEAAAEL